MQTSAPAAISRLLPVVAGVFLAYLVIGIALPVIPLHVHERLKLDTFVVGIVAGTQFASSLLFRLWSGAFADRRGGQRAMVVGLVLAAGAGLLYGLSLRFVSAPSASVAFLLLGRAVLGAAQSFIISGAFIWGVALAGSRNTGQVMSWVGTAIYVAFAVGAPAGSAIYSARGFGAIALATTLIPLLALGLVASRPAVAAAASERAPVARVIGAVWVPGLGLACASVGFGAIATFIALLFAEHGWGHAWLALSAASAAFVLGRLLFGTLPDRIGGARAAVAFIAVEAAGQVLIWIAPSPALALWGAVLTGLGYSLVYPGFGVEAVRHVPPEHRGLAAGAYAASLDVSLGLANPVLGLVADRAGLRTVFLASAALVICAAGVALSLLRRPALPAPAAE